MARKRADSKMRRARGPVAPAEAATRPGEVWIYGHHPVRAALANESRKVLRLVGTAEALAQLAQDPAISPRLLAHAHAADRAAIERLVGPDAVHQGLAVLTRALAPDLRDVLERLDDASRASIVVLDQVTDPHNVGAILRSAAAFGAAVVVAPERGAPEETGAMAKSASGALEVVPYIRGGNLVRLIEDLKERRFWVIGLDPEAKPALRELDLNGRIALVLGAEGHGLRRLVRESCDHLARLPIAAMESLNVSNAAAVALYEWTRQSEDTPTESGR